MAPKREEPDKNTSKVQPFKRDGSFQNRGPLLGSGRGFNELENSVTLHRQHTAKMKSSKIYESNGILQHDDTKEENKLDLRLRDSAGPQ